MKIYKNGAKVELDLDEFLDLLEEDALDDVIYLVMDLDSTGSIKNSTQEGTYKKIYYSDGMNMEEMLEAIGEDVEHYSLISEETLDKIFGGAGAMNGFIDEERLMDTMLLSNEDLRVRRIVDRFFYLLDE